VFALTPRHWEETSLASLEAAATGTPIVVTEQADVPNLAAAQAGFVVPLDPSAIGDAVVDAAARRSELGANARRLIEQQHSADAVVDRLERLLRDI
jgi:glycosyltransferase involved in cell wall biosynthesis